MQRVKIVILYHYCCVLATSPSRGEEDRLRIASEPQEIVHISLTCCFKPPADAIVAGHCCISSIATTSSSSMSTPSVWDLINKTKGWYTTALQAVQGTDLTGGCLHTPRLLLHGALV